MYEYKIVQIPRGMGESTSTPEIERTLYSLGELDWELVTVVEHRSYFYYHLKREK